jgi:hypothetical protein
MSTKAQSPAAYGDVKFVLDMALQKPGLKYVLKSPGRAVNFKQRCNRFRSLMREMAAEALAGTPGFRAETAYDPLVIRQINEKGEPDRHGAVLLFEHQEIEGTLLDPETGEEIPIPGITDTLEEF